MKSHSSPRLTGRTPHTAHSVRSTRDLTMRCLAVIPLLTLLGLGVVACQTSSSDPESSGPPQKPASRSQEKALEATRPSDRDAHADGETQARAATEKKTDTSPGKRGAGDERKPGADTSPAEKKPTDGAMSAPLVAKRFVIAGGVEDREPLPVETLRVNDTVTAFLEMVNESDQQGSVEIVFEHESGEKVGFISLPVPAASPRHRTWGRTRLIQKPGNWTAVVTGENGKELARQSFSVAEAS